ncbi:hypothetical protein DLJ53_09580 [Acuticoccus sediminis]|uniref:Uncharacterized protein n=1 Tax=Acuticoccus sediminis TaxID=2184697 RepID=A0A8B2NP40_9HYPH|nr:DUF5691 domain-containing protein [Acuticoccus sediminis]RAI01656.1 hypothetical protein DLJ53_09580 [Acuticoccus sediminis]
MDDLAAALDAMKARWMVGGSAAAAAPAGWDGGDGDATLLAIACQAEAVAFRPAAPTGLAASPPLPRLTLPTLPDGLRGAFRRLVSAKGIRSPERGAILTLLANRGYSVHPADLMPAEGDPGVPAVYAPWRAWSAGTTAPADALTDATWDDVPPAERRAALAALRRSDPAEARRLVTAHAGKEAADGRLALVSILETGLRAEDKPALEAFLSDRSGKVRTVAETLLARLGAVSDGEAAGELAAFYAVETRDRRVLVRSRTLKTSAQRQRRWGLAERVTLTGFAKALGLGVAELVDAFVIDDTAVDFIATVARTGDHASVAALAERALAATAPRLLAPLFDRLGDDARSALLPALLAAGGLDVAAEVCRADFGSVPAGTLRRAPEIAQLIQSAKDLMDPKAAQAASIRLATGLLPLGLLADQDAARRLVLAFTDASLSPSDPSLALLAFNARLPRRDP